MEQRKFQGQFQRSGPRSYKAADYSAGFAKRDAWLKQGESEVSDDYNKAELAAMTTVASILLNLDETLCRE